MPARLWLKIIAPNGAQIGPGKIALLKAVAAERSIAAAARALDMSYRRAWLLIEEINAACGQKAVAARVGGAARGGAALTARGQALIALYDRLEAEANATAAGELAAFFDAPSAP